MGRLIILSKPIYAPILENKKHRFVRWIRPLLILAACLIMSACVTLQDPETVQDNHADSVAVIESVTTAEQTFTTRHAEMDQLTVWLKVDKETPPTKEKFFIDLYTQSNRNAPLLHLAYDLRSLVNSETLTIPLKKNGAAYPAGQYSIKFSVDGGKISLFGRNEDAYAPGELSINDMPIDADLSFRLGYNYGINAVIEDLRRWLNEIWLVLPFLVLLWIPGRLILRASRLENRYDWGERSAISIGLSAAVIPILMLWTTLIGLHWNRTSVLIGAGILILVYIITTNWRSIKLRISWASLVLAGVILFSLFIRLAMVRDLAFPAWVDSVHHALITRIILEQGGFPQTYAPYVQASTVSYHVGYHSILAAFIWLSGLGIAQAMLVFGQVLNALVLFGVYLLTTTFTRRPIAGIFATIIAGLMTPMPAYYTSWGRYTQLAGLLLLPVGFLFIKTLLDQPSKKNWWRMDKSLITIVLLAVIMIAGILLVHYRVLAFLGALVLAYLLVEWITAVIHKRLWPKLVKDASILLVIGGAALLLTLPWWPTALRTYVLPVGQATGSKTPFSDFSWRYLNTAFGYYAMGLAGLGLIWSIIQKRTLGIVMVLWIIIMFLMANLGVWQLPGASFINNTSVAISLFIPIALLGGYLLGWTVAGWEVFIPSRWKSAYWTAIGLAGLTLMVFSARSLLPILNAGTILARQADLPAIKWVDENLPDDAKFLINPFLWGYGLYAGNDGGYWISPLAGRYTLPPPVLYGNDFTDNRGASIVAQTKQAISLVSEPKALHDFLLENGIHYVYCGVRGGIISPKLLIESNLFDLLYDQSGVKIFEVLETPTS